MNILVIVGYCLKINSSANLCHISYINGLLDLGHSVDLITVDEKNLLTDNSMRLPDISHVYEYQASYYEQFSCKHKISTGSASENKFSDTQKKENKFNVKAKIKKIIRNIYGVYGTDIAWYFRAKRFRSNNEYDIIISLAYPPTSHYLAEFLIKKRHVKTKHWLQIWEDPWYADLFGIIPNKKIKKEEERLLSVADKICYVSPLTLKYQKQFYSASALKMFWKPLPSYYKSPKQVENSNDIVFGYFGDYNSNVRNLEPFYQVAISHNLNTYICGDSDKKYATTETVHVYRRMPLQELREYEEKVNILVFVCNLKGGQIPGKIYQYSATNKHILFILDGTEVEKQILKKYFEKFNRYIFCDNTIESISQAIFKIKERSQEIQATPVQDFEPHKIVQSILDEMET